MRKFALCIKSPMTYNAGSKAVIDATEISVDAGYFKLVYAYNVPLLMNNNWLKPLNKILNILLCIFASLRISKSNEYFIQWPSPGKSIKILFSTLIRRRVRFTILIHDLNDLRGILYPEDERIMYTLFSHAQTIIVHTDSMKNYLISKGVEKSKLRVLYTFDYITDDIVEERGYSKKVAFAGNLSKSTFLNKIKLQDTSIEFYCYGANYKNDNHSIVYKGKFSPNNVSQIEGSWGLVWDGDSTESCTGEFGDYLKYNSPHKVSLYIVAELPIIIWKEQALANYIVEKNIGITISSIDEIPEKLSMISEPMYMEMRENIKAEAEILRRGENLKRFL